MIKTSKSKTMNIEGVEFEYQAIRNDKNEVSIHFERSIPKFDSSIELKTNAMIRFNPNLYSDWFFEVNDKLGFNIYKMAKYGTKKVWWVCSRCGSPYDMKAEDRSVGRNCPYCAGKRINETNSLASLKPDLLKFWDYEKNKNLNPNEIASVSGMEVWWKCNKGKDHEWFTRIADLSSKGGNCPFCLGQRVSYTNSLESLRSDIALEWHPTKNNKTPKDYVAGSNEEVWWRCKSFKDHEWKTTISSRTGMDTGCPYCSNNRVLKGFNDIWTTHPHIAKLLLNEEDGYKYTYGSNKKLDWKCPDCDGTVRSKTVSSVLQHGVNCNVCKDNLTFGERMVYYLLRKLGISFIYDQSTKWSKGKRYDFLLDEYGGTIIEVQGEQHSNGAFEKIGGKTLEEEKENDRLKYELAMENGIKHYIYIDTYYSDFEYIKNNILSSKLKDMLNIEEDDFSDIDLNIKNNLVLETWKLWNSNIKSTKEISDILSISGSTVRRYLKLGASLNKCDYKVIQSYEYTKKPVVKLTLDGVFIEEYESISDAKRKNNLKSDSAIGKVCRGKSKQAYGYNWMYLEDYELLLSKGETPPVVSLKDARQKEIVKLDRDLNYIEEFSSPLEASKNVGAHNSGHIVACCKRKKKTAYGFKWMYKDEYELFKSQQKN